VNVEVHANGVRVPREGWASFWGAFSHVVRNAIDHGIESPEERRATDKPTVPTVRLESTPTPTGIVIEISDDGRGIDWDEVKKAAEQHGMAHASSGELEAALFADGVTTRRHVSEISGRGIGLGAAQEAARHMKGTLRIESERGNGTTVRFELPLAEAERHSSVVAAS
jgi:two-component system chemotaxis sensor kinase CheA